MAKIKYCTLCERKVEPKVHYTFYTFLLVISTFGLWIIALAFYRKKCPICKTTALDKVKKER